MKKIINITLIGLVALFVVISCKKSQVDELKAINSVGRDITGEGIVAGNVKMDNESVTIPFKISLSGPATKAFQVGLTLNNDTVNQLITNGTLVNTILMPGGSVEFPNVINVKFGADSATGTAIVRLTTLERNYGKKLAFAFKLSNPEKDNKIVGSKSNILVILNPADLFKESDIHYLSIANGGGGILDIDYKGNYVTTPAGVTIPIIINLANQAGSAFNVKVKLNRDTIATLVNTQVLPSNTIQLADADFTLDTLIRVNSNENTATIRISIPWPVFDAYIQANKRFAFALSLTDPSKQTLHPTKSKVIVLVEPEVNLDNNSFITGEGTGLKAEYFTDYQFLDQDGRKPTLVRIDETIDFGGDWLPYPLISRDNYSSRWTGEFLAPVRGDYIFYQTRWDDGSRLFINGKAIIDDFTSEWDKDYRKATIHLERGVRYKIEAHHRENVGGQQAHLEYEVPSAGIRGKRTVPKNQLYPAQ